MSSKESCLHLPTFFKHSNDRPDFSPTDKWPVASLSAVERPASGWCPLCLGQTKAQRTQAVCVCFLALLAANPPPPNGASLPARCGPPNLIETSERLRQSQILLDSTRQSQWADCSTTSGTGRLEVPFQCGASEWELLSSSGGQVAALSSIRAPQRSTLQARAPALRLHMAPHAG